MPDPKNDGSFNIDFKLLPPDLVVKLWTLGLDANTSKVNIAYQEGAFTTALSYNYGGSLSASVAYRPDAAKLSLGVDPSNGKLDLGLVYRGFNFSASENVQQSSTSLSLGYGAPLLPYPDVLADSFRAANASLQRMVGDSGSALQNPLSYYNLHSNDVTAIGKAVGMGQAIYNSGKNSDANNKSDSFGVSVKLNYTPQSGLVIFGGVGWRF
jgi:hypothetical protein